jgi:dipeptidase E
MRNLFLAGGGSAEDSRELDDQFVTNLGRGESFAYVPVAMPSSRYPDNCRWIESVFLPLGVRQIAMWTSLEDKTLDLLRGVGGLYIGGGNTAKLLREVRSSGPSRRKVGPSMGVAPAPFCWAPVSRRLLRRAL